LLLRILDLIGVAVFAVSGALAAGRKRLDLLGVIVLAMVTAIGGGTIRDLLLGRQPVFWLVDSSYVTVIVGAALLTFFFARGHRPPDSVLLVADALGLALFSVAGARIAEASGVPPAGCIVLGTVAGAAGGVVRDVLSNEIPLVLTRGNLYASAAIAGTGVYFLLLGAGASRPFATLTGMAVVASVRFASIWWGLKLPVFKLEDTGEHASSPDTDHQP
jgi:uncharacterized membrane protein YeiH